MLSSFQQPTTPQEACTPTQELSQLHSRLLLQVRQLGLLSQCQAPPYHGSGTQGRSIHWRAAAIQAGDLQPRCPDASKRRPALSSQAQLPRPRLITTELLPRPAVLSFCQESEPGCEDNSNTPPAVCSLRTIQQHSGHSKRNLSRLLYQAAPIRPRREFFTWHRPGLTRSSSWTMHRLPGRQSSNPLSTADREPKGCSSPENPIPFGPKTASGPQA